MRHLSEQYFEEPVNGFTEGLLYADADGQVQSLPFAPAGQALISGGPGEAPEFTDQINAAGGGLNASITNHFGGDSDDLDSLTNEDYDAGSSVFFVDSSYYLWGYICRAGTVTGGQITSVSAGADTISDPTTAMQNLAVGDRIQFVTTDTLPAPLAKHIVYYVKAKPTTTTATLALTNGGALIDITDNGTGTHYWVRHESPYRVVPTDYNPSSNAFFWERVRAKWNHFPLSFVAFPSAVTLTNPKLARHTFDFEILGWGLSCDDPVTAPGSGASTPFQANLKKTGVSNETLGAVLAPTNLALIQGSYYVDTVFTKAEHIITMNKGEALHLNVINVGNVKPVGIEVHLLCRRPVLMF